MSRPKKQKQVTISKTKLRKFEEETAAKMIMLSAAYLMDEFDYNEDQLIAYWEGLTRYAEAIDQKLISVRQVAQLIEEHTGLKMGVWE